MPFMAEFDDAPGLMGARLAALKHVKTEWFFFLDHDDDLPNDFLRVLDRCIAANTPIAYTDELVHDSVLKKTYIRKSADYSEMSFIKNPMLIHHLALCKTALAIDVLKRIQDVNHNEMLMFFELAKYGATYIDEVGYIWNRSHGLSRKPAFLFAQVQSATFAFANRSK